jgi:cell division FtsZ-interacting protein ZapD
MYNCNGEITFDIAVIFWAFLQSPTYQNLNGSALLQQSVGEDEHTMHTMMITPELLGLIPSSSGHSGEYVIRFIKLSLHPGS